MKSHPYASKRRLTNICCIVVSLAFAKLVFAAYLAAGGHLFTLPSFDDDSKAKQIAEAQSKRVQAYQEAAQSYEQSQRALTQAVAELEKSQNPSHAYNQDTTHQNIENSGNSGNSVRQNTGANSGVPSGTTQNFALANERLETKANTSFSFLPQRRESTANTQDNLVANNNTQNTAQGNPIQTNTQTAQQNTQQNAQVPAPQQIVQNQQIQHIAQNTLVQNHPTETMLERSDMVNDDFVLADASALTADTARAQMRANLTQSMFPELENMTETERKNLAQMPTQSSNYSAQNAQNTQNTDLTQVAQNTVNRNNNTNAPQRNSFFSLVGTAHAADENYARPDEATTVPIPSPTVQAYSSPDTLEYKQSELNRKEEELLALQQQMNARLKELNALEGRIGNMVQDANSMHSDKFKHIIETYTNMKARVAAQSLVTLDEDIAVRILSGMKSKQAGEIFSYMDPVQSARLSSAMSEFSL